MRCAFNMYNKEPDLSVIMGVCCSHDQLPMLIRAVRSILAQTFSGFEFLICESESSPEVSAALQSLEGEDIRIRLVDGNGANTLAKKLNRCISQSRGTWLARMDADDFSYPERFQRQLNYLKLHRECDVIGCWVREIGGVQPTVRMLPAHPTKRDFRFTLPFVHPALILRRDAVVSAGGYSENPAQTGCEDYDLLLRLYAQGYQGANLQEILIDYSIVSSQLYPRKYRLFVNEFMTRWCLFRSMGLLPQWLLWAVKPLVVGLLPRKLLYRIKHSTVSHGSA